jgi:hypothetical protein
MSSEKSGLEGRCFYFADLDLIELRCRRLNYTPIEQNKLSMPPETTLAVPLIKSTWPTAAFAELPCAAKFASYDAWLFMQMH